MSHLSIRRGAVAALAAAALAAAGLAAAAAAPAQAATPKPGYAQFTGCPNTPDLVFICQYAKINGGYFKFGNVTVPVTAPITISTGVTNDDPGKLVYTTGGGLKTPKLKVPGGLTGITGIPEKILNAVTFGANNVYAVAELAGQASVLPDGAGFKLPIRVKLQSPFLASTCALGTTAKPIVLNLITGTTAPPPPNKPISGKLADDVFFDDATFIIHSNNATYVDNAFAVPGASGCGSYIGGLNVGFINDIVNLRVGLPSAAGKNTVIQSDLDLQAAGPTDVYGS